MKKIRLYIAKLDLVEGKNDKILSILAKRYVDKYNKYRVPKGKEQELLAGALLYKYLGVTTDTVLTENEHGKISLENGPEFNLSHSEDYVVLAIADIPVGVDVEHGREMRWNVARKVFSEDWLEELRKAELESEAARNMLFAKYWTTLESVIKLLGCGFAEEIDRKKLDELEPLAHTIELGEYAVTCVAQEETKLDITILDSLSLDI